MKTIPKHRIKPKWFLFIVYILTFFIFSSCDSCKGCSPDDCSKVEYDGFSVLKLSIPDHGTCHMPITDLGDWCINFGNDWNFSDPYNMSNWDNTKYTLVVFIEFSSSCQDEIVSHYQGFDNIFAGKTPNDGVQLQYKVNLDDPSCGLFLTDLPYLLDVVFIYKVEYYSPCLDGCTAVQLCSGLSYRPLYQATAMSIGPTGGQI